MKLCECGCGRPAAIATRTDRSRGWVDGQPLRFARGHKPIPPLVERFWAKVDRRGPEDCWPWTASTHRGYGLFRAEKGRDMVRAHRYSWTLAHGQIPPGIRVLHKCDNPPCVNPAHLFLGTQLDNVRDCEAKGRRRVGAGERNGRAKLTREQVTQIRAEYRRGMQRDLARKYGVSRPTISRIVRRAGWREVAT